MKTCGQTLNGILKDCYGNFGGIKYVWISSSHIPMDYTINSEVITYITDDRLGATGVGEFVKFEFGKNGATMTSKANIDNNSNIYNVTTELQMSFPKIETNKKIEIEKLLMANDLVVIVGDNNGFSWLLGNDYPVYVSSSNSNFGSKKNDANTFQVTLTNISNKYPLQVTYLPWEHQPKSYIRIYETVSNDILDREEWKLIKSYQVSSNKPTTIEHSGEGQFLGWYNGKDGSFISDDSTYTFTPVYNEYILVEKVKYEKPIIPTFTSQITLYRTSSDDVRDRTQWAVDKQRLLGDGEVDIDDFWTISYNGGTSQALKFKGWYNDYGVLLTTDNVYSFIVEDDSYTFIAKVQQRLNSVILTDREGFTRTDYFDNGIIPEKEYTGTYVKAEIGEGIEKIGTNAFNDCTNITSVTIPSSVIEIGDAPFEGCGDLSDIYYNGTIRDFEGIIKGDNWTKDLPLDCVVHCKDGDIHLFNPPTPTGYTLLYTSTDGNIVECNPNFDANIISNEYVDGQGIITFDSEITRIDSRAFINCITLKTIEIPNSVTFIGTYAFSRCESLTSIEIPDSVTGIGINIFEFCYSLTSVTIGSGVTRIIGNAFYNCSGLTSVTIGNSVTSIGEMAFYKCISLTSIEIPDSVTSIGTSAFSNCSGLTSVTIPNSVTSIGDFAFSSCLSLTSITIPNSVTSIGEQVFQGCESLTSVTIGNSVTSIGKQAFQGCITLKTIEIPDSVTTIGDDAFTSCSSLTSVTIPNSVTSIGDFAFSSCLSLTSITIPNSVTSIGNAFFDCESLTSINYIGTKAQFTSITKGSYWKTDVPTSCIVHCTDGDYPISDFN